jgi:hypothetical protein
MPINDLGGGRVSATVGDTTFTVNDGKMYAQNEDGSSGQFVANLYDWFSPEDMPDYGKPYKFNVPTDVGGNYWNYVDKGRQEALDAIRSGQGVELSSLQTLAPRGNEIIPANPASGAIGDQYDSIFGTKVAKDLATNYGKALGYTPEEIQKLAANRTADTLGSAWAQGNPGLEIGETPINRDLISYLAQQKGVSAADPMYQKALSVADTADQKFGSLRDIEANSPGFFKGLGQQMSSLGPVPAILATIAGMPQVGIALMNAAPSALQGDVKGAALSLVPTGLELGGAEYLKNATSALSSPIAQQAAQGAIKGGITGLISGDPFGGAIQGGIGGGIKGSLGVTPAAPTTPEYTSYGDTYDSYDLQGSAPDYADLSSANGPVQYDDYYPFLGNGTDIAPPVSDFNPNVGSYTPPDYTSAGQDTGLKLPVSYGTPKGLDPTDLGTGLSASTALNTFNNGLSPSVIDLIGQGRASDFGNPNVGAGQGLQLPDYGNIKAMGGGQGLTVPTDTGPVSQDTLNTTSGTLGANGFQSDTATPAIGNSASFINDPKNADVATTGEPASAWDKFLASQTSFNSGLLGLLGGALAGYAAAPSATPAPKTYISSPKPLLRDTSFANPGASQNTSNAYLLNPLVQQQGGSAPVAQSSQAQVPWFYTHSPYGTIGMASGGQVPSHMDELQQLAQPSNGRYLKGPGDGMSDSIPAIIDGHQPAKLATGEFVVPADVVSQVGDGDSDAGSAKLQALLAKVRQQKYGKKTQPAPLKDGTMEKAVGVK